MDHARRKELKAQYRQLRPEMGVYALRCPPAGRIYLAATQNLTAALNSIRFQLGNNSFPVNRQLCADLLAYGADSFLVETLELLDYDKDNDLKTDYREDLAVLKEFWRDRLMAEGAAVENLIPKDR